MASQYRHVREIERVLAEKNINAIKYGRQVFFIRSNYLTTHLFT